MTDSRDDRLSDHDGPSKRQKTAATPDRGICCCPPPLHLSKFAQFIWWCQTDSVYWPLEQLIDLQTALECWDDFRVVRMEGESDRIKKKAEKFAKIWLSSIDPRTNDLGYPACLTNGSMMSYPDLLEEWLIDTSTPDPWGISNLDETEHHLLR